MRLKKVFLFFISTGIALAVVLGGGLFRNVKAYSFFEQHLSQLINASSASDFYPFSFFVLRSAELKLSGLPRKDSSLISGDSFDVKWSKNGVRNAEEYIPELLSLLNNLTTEEKLFMLDTSKLSEPSNQNELKKKPLVFIFGELEAALKSGNSERIGAAKKALVFKKKIFDLTYNKAKNITVGPSLISTQHSFLDWLKYNSKFIGELVDKPLSYRDFLIKKNYYRRVFERNRNATLKLFAVGAKTSPPFLTFNLRQNLLSLISKIYAAVPFPYGGKITEVSYSCEAGQYVSIQLAPAGEMTGYLPYVFEAANPFLFNNITAGSYILGLAMALPFICNFYPTTLASPPLLLPFYGTSEK